MIRSKWVIGIILNVNQFKIQNARVLILVDMIKIKYIVIASAFLLTPQRANYYFQEPQAIIC
jgi:hypothetical protein